MQFRPSSPFLQWTESVSHIGVPGDGADPLDRRRGDEGDRRRGDDGDGADPLDRRRGDWYRRRGVTNAGYRRRRLLTDAVLRQIA